jgi:uncharacterized protein GlcG (DUF336 family)
VKYWLSPLLLMLLGAVTACGGGGGSATVAAEKAAVAEPVANSCTDNCFLSSAEVEQVLAQAAAEAQARQVGATIAVVDRVGNVLAVFTAGEAQPFVTVSSTAIGEPQIVGGLENLNFVPATLAAISKALTGAYLSTGGNAFTTRTASQIVQENFNPGEKNVPSGPLFGVQFSQLPCSDFSQRFGSGVGVGPHRAPLGLAADPGGLPLYKNGRVVGGVGVMADARYSLDKVISNFDDDLDELIATAATVGFAAPLDIRADRITLVGKTARFSDARVSDLLTDAAQITPFAQLLDSGSARLVAVTGYFDGLATLAGTAFGQAASGIRPADAVLFADAAGNSLDAFVFVDAGNQNRYPASSANDAPAGSAANSLRADEVQVILNEALALANQSRAQIRVPVGSQARVTVSIVDSNGAIVGMARTRDGPVFGADVSLQKARTATFFSGTGRSDGAAPADILRGLPKPLYLAPLDEPIDLEQGLSVLPEPAPVLADYVSAAQQFLGDPGALEASGTPVAFSDRAGGNLSRPHYPDGPASGPPGPFSKPAGQWSVFSVGLQLDLSYNAIIHHIAFVFGLVEDVPANCSGNTGLASQNPFTQQGAVPNIANGIQIFPGSVPIYRDGVLVGGIGVSGDGVDQDDMIAFLGLQRAAERLASGLENAPVEMRADKLDIPSQPARLRYVNCPQIPFINSDTTEVCNGY